MSVVAFRILEILDKLEPFRIRRGRAGLELRAHRVSIYAFLITIALSAIILLLIGWHQYFSPLSATLRDIGSTFALGVSFAGLTAMLASVSEAIFSFVALKRSMLQNFLLEVEWDHGHARQLDSFDKKDLKRAQEFLEMRTNRARERIKSFVGGPDKLAVLILLAGSWAVYKEIPWLVSIFHADWADPSNFFKVFFFFLLVFGCGILIGAVCLNFHVQRYAYQMDILKLQLSSRD